jgi:2-amino-4-hydroxy-6-hydroxymethyldihydropteridine diphosphokinase
LTDESRAAAVVDGPVAIALGSNLGDRQAHLEFAVRRLSALLTRVRVSSWRETAPVGVEPQPTYLNGAVAGEASMAPQALLQALWAIEADAGRVRPYPGAPRSLDLDLILFGEVVLDTPTLVLPHPRFRERAFVLDPLAEVAPDLIDPVTGLTVAELWARNNKR